jgi:dihydroxynaphthoic acid synthetase
VKLSEILYEKREGVSYITLNRPEIYNALSTDMVGELQHAFIDAAEDDTIGVIVVTGTGEKAFCSGGDVKKLGARNSSTGRSHMRRMGLLAYAIRNCGKPVIAAVNGYAIGGGHELHLMCDLTIAAEHAKFGQVGPKVSSVPVWGATQMLARTVGEKRGREILYLCKQYTAQESLNMGLVNEVVPYSELYSTVDEWCQSLLDKSPECLRISKLMMNQESDHNFYGAFSAGSELLSLHYSTPEFAEGPAAFLDKRQPNFRKFRNAPQQSETASKENS